MAKFQPGTDPEKLARVAELYYVDNLSYKEIIAELAREGIVPSTFTESNVAHWVEQARTLGVVAFYIDPSFANSGRLNDRLSDRLMREFDLEEAIVVDTSPSVLQDTKAADLHTSLANQTGMRLSEVLNARTPVLVAGGRTVVQIARMINRRHRRRSNIRIDPLSGRNWTGSWQLDGTQDLERPLDADDAALIMASAFPKSGTRFSQIGHPLYAETTELAQAIIRDHCAFLPGGEWNWGVPHRQTQHAICGIGVLHPQSGHRIMRFLEMYLREHGLTTSQDLEKLIEEGALAKAVLPEEPDKSAPYLARVAGDLFGAFVFAAEHNLGYFGDIANRLFPCLPLPSELKEERLPKRDHYEGLLQKLDALNRRAIVMEWRHLRQASTWVTAGGTLKLSPIWTLLIIRYIEQSHRPSGIQKDSIISKLTTDTLTAQALLTALASFKKASDSVRQWYVDLASVLFQEDGQVSKTGAGAQ
jgi:DNA-binding transcriptional regulator LsrR (DeoR family)